MFKHSIFKTFLLATGLLMSTGMWADWNFSYKKSDGNWTYNVAPAGDGFVHVNMDANSIYYIYVLVDGNGWASGNCTMTEGNSTNYDLNRYDNATYTDLKIQTNHAGEYKFTLSWYDEKQHITAVYPAVNWSAVSFVGVAGNCSEYANTFKVSAPSGVNAVEVQLPGFASEKSIYTTFPDAAFGEVRVNGTKINYDVQGAGIAIYASNFTARETVVDVMNTSNTLVRWRLHVLNNNAIDPSVTVSASSGNAAQGCDGNVGTRWESEHNDNQWWCVNLGTQTTFNTIRFVWEGAYGKSFDLLGSNDAINWTTLKEVRDQSLSGFPFTQDIELAEDVTYQYVKFQGIKRGTGYGYSFWEFSVWENTLAMSDLVKVQDVAIDMASATNYTLAANTDYTTSSTGALSYSSNKTSVATVDENGVITAVSLGSATITIRQAEDENYRAGETTLTVTVSNTGFGPTVAPTAPTIPQAQVRAIYSEHYTLAVNPQYNLANWGSSVLTEERTLGSDKARIYTMTNAVIVWGNNAGSGDNATIRGTDGNRNGSYVGLDASLMEYLHVDIWCDHVRNFTSVINDNGRGAQGNTTAGQWTSYDVPLSGINHGETGIENVRWIKFDGFAADDVVAIANVYFYTTQDGSDNQAPAVTSATYVDASATYTTAQVTVVATDNVGVIAYHFVDATNSYDKSYSVTSATESNETIKLTGLKAGKTYNFTVTAKDATGNETATGAVVTVTTPTIEGNGNVFYGIEGPRNISAWGVDYNVTLYYSAKWNANGSVTAELYLDDPDNLQSKAGCVVQILDYVTNNGNPIYYDMHKTNGVWSATMEGPFEQNKNDFRFRLGAGTTTEEPRQSYKVGAESAPYTRDVTAGKYGTLCLPFTAAVTGVQLYTISGKTETNIVLAEVEGNVAEAGKAYVYYAENAGTLTATYTAVAAHDINAGLVGALKNTQVTLNGETNQNIYFLSNNQLKHWTGNAEVTVAANKAYFDLTDVTAPASNDAPARIAFEGHVATDIEATAVEAQPVKFIENGKLYIRTANGIYDATGRLVK